MTAPGALLRRIAKACFLPVFAAVLYLALMPNYGRSRFLIVPMPVYRWICEHDDFDNITAFAVLASFAFLVGKNPRAREYAATTGAFARIFASRSARLTGLLAMVCVLELLQKWIPGRVSSMRDVCTGWSGIFAAWLISVLLDARAENSAAARSVTG